jgi:hypothetical protein
MTHSHVLDNGTEVLVADSLGCCEEHSPVEVLYFRGGVGKCVHCATRLGWIKPPSLDGTYETQTCLASTCASG